MKVIEQDSKFLAVNSLMDYSLLFIKAKKKAGSTGEDIEVMPAMICVGKEDGST